MFKESSKIFGGLDALKEVYGRKNVILDLLRSQVSSIAIPGSIALLGIDFDVEASALPFIVVACWFPKRKSELFEECRFISWPSHNHELLSAIMAGDDDDDSKTTAIRRIYAHFYKGGPAYKIKEVVYHRYYCKACLDNETAAVKAAREEYGQQGRDASVEVLQAIAMGRIEFFTPRHDLMLDHLRLYCEHATEELQEEAKSLQLILYRD